MQNMNRLFKYKKQNIKIQSFIVITKMCLRKEKKRIKMKAIKLKTIICPYIYVSGSKAPLVRPVGLFGRGLSVDLPLLLVLVDSEGSASENVA